MFLPVYETFFLTFNCIQIEPIDWKYFYLYIW